mmetsp:Transcript_18698/g.39250  ORF Transcript_18698/g.39250 Transcript_18698/m.39250 type:complete len:305 (+) Transcript_18698:1620-2534(+)
MAGVARQFRRARSARNAVEIAVVVVAIRIRIRIRIVLRWSSVGISLVDVAVVIAAVVVDAVVVLGAVALAVRMAGGVAASAFDAPFLRRSDGSRGRRRRYVPGSATRARGSSRGRRTRTFHCEGSSRESVVSGADGGRTGRGRGCFGGYGGRRGGCGGVVEVRDDFGRRRRGGGGRVRSGRTFRGLLLGWTPTRFLHHRTPGKGNFRNPTRRSDRHRNHYPSNDPDPDRHPDRHRHRGREIRASSTFSKRASCKTNPISSDWPEPASASFAPSASPPSAVRPPGATFCGSFGRIPRWMPRFERS